MEKDTKISLIVPTYNREVFLSDCINSIISQSYSNLEIIIVDDGSTDNSKKLVLEYMAKDHRIIYVEQKNCGVGVARNTGLGYCTGDFICFVDSDDTIDIEFCKTMLMYMKDDIDIVVCGVKFNNNGNAYNEITSIHAVSGLEACLNILEDVGNTGYVYNKMFRSSVFLSNHIRFPIDMIYEDVVFCYEYCMKSNKVQYINNVLYCQNKGHDSLCSDYDNPRRMKDLIKLINAIDLLSFHNIAYNKSFLQFLNAQVLRIAKCYNKSNYDNNVIVYKECINQVVDRIINLKRA